ncbi:DNA polymerase III subunit delta [Mycoplasmopsis pulmonis]|uniref:DNA polymerase III subunit delta n=1 Tax=Mycoplasmopsis pulmonis TaxID=2107 RepID=UPI002ACD88DC|nr:DNA polymerase III subunit delta [Mycoplasmopsis pulmonis]MDZ7293528.1 DNA polymerase III subunit delta [Mycoplasmopsis pulmonis]
MHLIYGQEEFLIESKTKNIIENQKKDSIVFTFYENFEIDDLLNDIVQKDLFSPNKIIHIKNWKLLENPRPSKVILNKLKLLSEIIENDKSLIFIFSHIGEIEKNFLSDFLLKKASVKHYKKLELNEKIKFIESYVTKNKIKISTVLISYLLINVSSSISIVINEINKLFLENQNITREMIEKSVGFYTKEPNFEFINSIKSRNSNSIWKTFLEQKNSGIEPLDLLKQISSAFILGNKINNIIKLDHSIDQVAKILNVHIYRAKEIFSLIKGFSQNSINEIIELLELTDKRIKTTYMDPEMALDFFILKLIRHYN